jgi:hypothetical protein
MDATVAGNKPIISGKRITGINMAAPKKSLGQHWLRDRMILSGIAEAAEITPLDTVLEIGPGLGTLLNSTMNWLRNYLSSSLERL